jgi:hypothetical protein
MPYIVKVRQIEDLKIQNSLFKIIKPFSELVEEKKP